MARIRISEGTGEWKPLPEGQCDFKILEVVEAASKAGNPQLKTKMEVVGGPSDGKTANDFYSLQPQALWRLYELCAAADIEMTETGELDPSGKPIYDFDSDDLIGVIIEFTVGQREYEGKKNNTFNKPQLSRLDPHFAKTQGAAKAAPTTAQTNRAAVVSEQAIPEPALPVPVQGGAGAARRTRRGVAA